MADTSDASRPAHGTERPRILVVYDDPAVGFGFKVMLQRRYDVVVAESGAAALELVAPDPDFDVIVSDLVIASR